MLDQTCRIIGQLQEEEGTPTQIWKLICQIPAGFTDERLLDRDEVIASFVSQYFPDCVQVSYSRTAIMMRWRNIRFTLPIQNEPECAIQIWPNAYQDCEHLLHPPLPVEPSKEEKFVVGYMELLRSHAGILPRMRYRFDQDGRQLHSPVTLLGLYWFYVRPKDKSKGKDKIGYWAQEASDYAHRRQIDDTRRYAAWKETIINMLNFKTEVCPRLEAFGFALRDNCCPDAHDMGRIFDQLEKIESEGFDVGTKML